MLRTCFEYNRISIRNVFAVIYFYIKVEFFVLPFFGANGSAAATASVCVADSALFLVSKTETEGEREVSLGRKNRNRIDIDT